MRILAIRGRNLASLAGSFEVDFRHGPLAETGLFAISGPTGAGKSTLLDALCLALYDATPRLARAQTKNIHLPDVRDETVSPSDTRTLLRRGTGEGFAEVDFLGNDARVYRARWSVRRARDKASGALQKTVMGLWQLPEEQAVGGHTKSEVLAAIAQRTGLSFEQFTRAVLLAQNEFFTFLKAPDDERAALLQTLTGTDLFERISQSAYDRHKREQAAIAAIEARLAGEQALAPEARAELTTREATVRGEWAARQQAGERIAAHLEWHRRHAALQGELTQAESRRAHAERACADAAALRRELERVEAVQGAAALVNESRRTASARAAASEALATARDKAATADQTARERAVQHEHIERTAQQIQTQRTALQPTLDEARRLDALIEAAEDNEAKESARATRATQDLAQARHAFDTASAEQRDAAHRLATARTHHAALDGVQALAQEWPRWAERLRRAREIADSVRELEDAHQTRQQACEQAARQAVLAEQTLAEALRQRAVCERQLRANEAACADLDLDKLTRQRETLDEQARDLDALRHAWREQAAAEAARQQALAEQTELAEAGQQAQARLDVALAALPAARDAEDLARRAAELVDLACNEAAQWRARLEAHLPCPVCGSTEHPYTEGDTPTRKALDAARQEHGKRRDTLLALQTDEREARRQLETVAGQEGIKQAQYARAAQRDAQARQAWLALAPLRAQWCVSLGVPDVPAAEEDWNALATRLETRRTTLATAWQQARARDAARQQAQQALARAQQAHGEALLQESRAASARANADSAYAHGDKALHTHRMMLTQTLDSLEEARLADWVGADWRTQWGTDPDAFQQARQAEVGRRQAARQDIDTWQARAETLHERVTALATQHEAALQTSQEASRVALEAAQRSAQWRAARLALFADSPWQSMTVAAIQAQLDDQVREHGARLDAARLAAQQARLQQATEQERVTSATRQFAAAEQDAADAQDALQHWLAAFNARHLEGPDALLEMPLSPEALTQWLARPPEWRQARREDLRRLDDARLAARAECTARREDVLRHDALRDSDMSFEALQTLAETIARDCRTLGDTHAELSHALREDDARRVSAAALQQSLDAQRTAARRWAGLNELIGSADGKKFRNQAQQLTLDVLLAHANAHLRHLARRYRLERVEDSLALLAIDEDMGDEKRSVHSLSGGESFLVSLALALGLASLSSHRVRVESLFVDEGFGSLDADTLAVAMDALDRLQAQGRKVGVISHVREMTERIGTRIEVRRLSGGESRLRVVH